jgi:hypothetical protein
MILLARAKQGYIRYFWLVLGWYVIAKVFEHLDVATYEALGFWSGHTLKHLIGAISLYYLLALVKAWDDSLARLSAVD